MEVERWQYDALGEKVVSALRKNDFDAHYFPSRDRAVNHVFGLVPEGSTVAIGGSVSLHELNLIDGLREKGFQLITIYEPDLSPEEMVSRMRRQLTSDVFLSSVNALTLDGYLVNVDSSGNRIAAMTFGPNKVILLVGANKICGNVDLALERVRSVAAPRNVKRINLYKEKIHLDNPCAETGICSDCRSKTRICRVYAVTRRKPMYTDVTVVVVGESLGF
jgi:hypothetical protein